MRLLPHLNYSYGPRLIVWPPVRQFLAHVAEIVARLIVTAASPLVINRGAGVISSPPTPHSSSTFAASLPLRSALRSCTEPHASVPLNSNENLAAERQPAARRRAATLSSLPYRRNFTPAFSPVSSNLTRHGHVLRCSCRSCCSCSCLDAESRPHEYRGGLRCNRGCGR